MDPKAESMVKDRGVRVEQVTADSAVVEFPKSDLNVLVSRPKHSELLCESGLHSIRIDGLGYQRKSGIAGLTTTIGVLGWTFDGISDLHAESTGVNGCGGRFVIPMLGLRLVGRLNRIDAFQDDVMVATESFRGPLRETAVLSPQTALTLVGCALDEWFRLKMNFWGHALGMILPSHQLGAELSSLPFMRSFYSGTMLVKRMRRR